MGGAICNVNSDTHIVDSEFVGNSAELGGAVYSYFAADVFVSGGRFAGNSAEESGGAIYAEDVYVEDGTQFLSNSASLMGGAVYAATVFDGTDTVLAGNDASSGGAIAAQFVYLDRAQVTDNNATAGGGLYASSWLQVADSRITGNTATGNGAGIWLKQVYEDVPAQIIRTLIADNTAQADGGGLWVEGAGMLLLANSTISQNAAPNGTGSGLHIDNGKHVRAINVTFADNTPGENLASQGTLELQNSIIATPGEPDCFLPLDPIVSMGHNLSDDESCISLDHDTDTTNVDVMLAPLAWTGGDTRTHALLPGSPAIDSGDAMACAAEPIVGIDQRGGPRNVGLGCDIGAHEQGAQVSLTLFGDGFE